MRKLRISFSLVIMLFLVGIFSSAAFANSTVLPNAPQTPAGVDTNGSLAPDITTDAAANDNGQGNVNETGKNVTDNSGTSVNDVIKSHDMVKNDGTTGNQRTHGEYQNNTNSCASCHQTHTGAAKNLLMKDGVYTTCTACHDGTLGFYNVFQASTAGTFGGDATHDASMHMANDSLQVSAAPGGNHVGTEKESWGKEFNCASCHSPHGSYSDRLLNYNVNNMGAEPSWEGGIAAWSKVYNFADVTTILANIQTQYDADSSYNPKDEYGKYILVRGLWSDFGLTAPTGTVSTKVIVAYTFKVDHGTWSSAKAFAPTLYGYEYYAKKWYVTKLYALTDTEITTDTDNNRVPDKVDGLPKPYTATEDAWVYDANDSAMKFDYQKGYIYADTDATLDAITYGQVARAYVVDLDLYQYPANDLALNKANANFAAGGMLDYVADANLGVNDYGKIKIAFSNDQGLYKNGAGGKGVAMSQYCAACHTDYLANSGTATGTFDKTSYRHTTESDSYTCVRCHFAHGTDRDTLKDAQGRTFKDVVADYKAADATLTDADAQTKATAWLEDKDTSSALKKFTNMSGCWSCHQSSHAEQLINNPDTTDAAKAVNYQWAGEVPALGGLTAIPNK